MVALLLAALLSPAASPLGAGDLLLVALPGEVTREITVDWQGNLDLGVLGRIPLAGARPEDAETITRSSLSRYFQATDGIVVRVLERRRMVRVTGAVAKPGLVVLKAGEDLLTALGTSGGATPEADLRRVQLLRADGGTEFVDVRARLADPLEPVPVLSAGDAVLVAELPAYGESKGDRARLSASAGVVVLGAIRTPGLYPVPSDARLSSLLAAAGGAESGADLDALQVTRDGHTEARGFGDLTPVVAGDVVVVPLRADADAPGGVRVTLIGGMRGGGRTRLPPGARLADAVAAMGAGDGASRLATLSIVRQSSDSVLTLRYDLDDAQVASDDLLVRLLDGDVVRVEAVAASTFERSVRYATAIGGVASALALVWALVDRAGAKTP